MLGQFFKRIWRFVTVAKTTTGNLIFLAIVGFILFTIFTSESVSIPESAAMVIDPTGIIVEQKQAVDPVSKFLAGYENEDSETLLRDVLEAIHAATDDHRIKVLVLDLNKFQGAAFSKLEEIGDALVRFKRAGKKVYAFGQSYSQSQYYIATHADEIYLDEQSHQMLGGVFLTGLGVYPTYFKSGLDKLKINFHVYKVGLYKGAVEPYERDDMSPESKRATLSWLNHLWAKYSQTVMKERDIDLESFNRYSNNYDQLLAEADNDPKLLAVQQNLVDDLISQKEWLDLLKTIVGEDGIGYNRIRFKDYLKTTRPPIPVLNPGSNKIAVIIASGIIYDGERPVGQIGSKSIVKLIQRARHDQSVKAIVLRVDSPGGSASAAELIRTELEQAKNEGKPIVVSMGSYAASGGYWIAATANKIFAQSTTITGSIGVFATIPTLEQSAANFGIYSDGVGTTNLSDSLNLLKDINPILDNTIRQSIEFTYRKFINLVADGRNMTPEQVDALAQGRVWAATDALGHGLIDAIGNLDDAIDSAALLSDLVDYEVLYLEKTLSAKELLLDQILNSSLKTLHRTTGGRVTDLMGLSVLTNVPDEFNELLRMSQSPGLYLRCLECQIRN